MPDLFNSVVVVGAGAVGSFFGAVLARAGHRVTLIGRPAHVKAIDRQGLRLEMAGRVDVVHLGATVDMAAVREADLVLFCVKSTDTDAVAREMAPHLNERAIVMSLQNGVENAPTLARHVRQMVVAACVYAATALPEPGVVKHFGGGNLVIGALTTRTDTIDKTLKDLAAVFGSAGAKVTISDDVMADLWSKLVMNCAYNAISALGQVSYGQLVAVPEVRAIQEAVVREVVALAAAENVRLELEPSLKAMENIAVAMPGQLSSTAQDLARRKPSEIDHLNGFVARRGRELGIATPVNATLHALVKLIESGYGGG